MKLQAGEYVSLGRVETILSTSPFVDNLFVYGESSQNFVIAVVVANVKQLALLAREVLGAEAEGKTHEPLCREERLEQEVQKRLVKQARHGEWLEILQTLRCLGGLLKATGWFRLYSAMHLCIYAQVHSKAYMRKYTSKAYGSRFLDEM